MFSPSDSNECSRKPVVNVINSSVYFVSKFISKCGFAWKPLCVCFQATGQEIPAIVISCIKIINLYGNFLKTFLTHF